MEAIEALRSKARYKRDRAIRDARIEYQQTLAQLRQLESTFHICARKQRDRPDSIETLIARAMPQDRLFTFEEVFALVECGSPDRVLFKSSVRVSFHNLAKKGAVRQVARDEDRHVLFCSRDYQPPESAYVDKRIHVVIEDLLREIGPASVTTIVVGLQSRGYRAGYDPHMLARSVRSVLSRRRELFKNDRKGRWSLVADR